VDALINRLSTRFLVVTVTPNILLVCYVSFLLAAGAPTRSPSLANALKVLDKFSIRQLVVMLAVILIISVAIHPLQTPLIQLVEGYWQRLPFGAAITKFCVNRFQMERDVLQQEEKRLEEINKAGKWDRAAEQAYTEVLRRQDWLPQGDEYLLPTALGNTLRMGEIRAGDRYGLNLEIAMPRLVPLLSAEILTELRDRRNQLDAVVRLCVAAGLATTIGLGLLLCHGHWLFLPFSTYIMCWLCYRSAVVAARSYSVSLAAAVDLYHLQLFDALQLKRPVSLAEECNLNATLAMLFRGVDNQDVDELRYAARKTDQQSGE
jgi:hypothetical protein